MTAQLDAIDELIGVPASGGELAMGAYEAASRTSNELALWHAPLQSADMEIIPDKQVMDTRTRDMLRNDAYVRHGAVVYKDSVVGEHFMLNSKPEFKILGLDEVWAEEFQEEVEIKFNLAAESLSNYFDASSMNTLTGLTRLAVGIYAAGGEVLAIAQWLRESGRPFNTAIQMIDLDRLSNPNGEMDTPRLRGGVQRNQYGAPTGVHIRTAHPTDWTDTDNFRWQFVPMTKPWGRQQVIYLMDQWRPDQTRAVSGMVAALKEMKMTRKFRDIVLQSAVLNATYAASIESELPTDVVLQQIGGTDAAAVTKYAASYLGAIAQYTRNSRALQIDGVKIPHFYPGTKMKLQNAGTPGGLGSDFEQSMLRYIAASLGISYEQLSKDYTQANYSNIRAANAETDKRMRVVKKHVADRFAGTIYRLWLEEQLNKGMIESMPRNAPNWYEGLNKDAYSACDWIGASRGQIEELKETQAAVLRVNNGISTREMELARMGQDYRKVFRQLSREKKLAEDLDLTFGQDKNSENMMNAASGTPSSTGDSPRSATKGEDTDE